jgi:predicted nucleic acid-binding protein
MIAYLDTSAVVKLYVTEEGSDSVRSEVSRAEAVATSTLGYAETRAALAAMARNHELRSAEHQRAKAALESDWPQWVRISVTGAICKTAGEMAERHALRGSDAVHLACYLEAMRFAGENPVRFLSFDKRQVRAAQALVRG